MNGTPTNYTLDLAAGLTQVLADGSSTYLYGLGRIGEQQAGGWMYHLSDALGNVRQLADASVNVTLARSYEPFGDALMTTGAGTSIYGFTGEQRDGTGLVYLRARYYGPAFGRFLSRDPWEGDPNQPMSYNVWLYVYANPGNFVDSSGFYAEDTHYTRTFAIAQQEIALRCPQCNRDISGVRLARYLAEGNLNLDRDPVLMPIPPGSPELHFTPLEDAWADLRRGIREDEPWFVGAALHEIQDYWSHYYEGYRWPSTRGHFDDWRIREAFVARHSGDTRTTVLRRLWAYGVIDQPTRCAFEREIGLPGAPLATLSVMELLDVWLRIQPGPIETRRAASWKDVFGYRTDDFFWFTQRDQSVLRQTRMAVREHIDSLDVAEMCGFFPGGRPPAQQVRRFLLDQE